MAKQKVSEAGADGLLKIVESSDPKLFAKAKECNLDVKLIASGVVREYGSISADTGAQFVVSAIHKAVTEASSEALPGLVVGSKDSYGRKGSVNFGVVRSNGDHFEANSWDPKISVDGVVKEVPFPSVATLKVVEKEFKKGDGSTGIGLNLVAVENVKEKDYIQTANMLKSLAINPSTITPEDAKAYKLVVLKGVVDYVFPADKWKDSKKLEVGHNVVESNESGTPHPVMSITLMPTQPEGFSEPTSVRVTFNQRKYTVPTILVEELLVLINIVKDKYPNDPNNQTKVLTTGMKGKSVLVVGTVNRFQQVVSKKKNQTVNYVDVSGYLIVEYPEDGAPDESPRADDPAPPATTKATPAEKKKKKDPAEVAKLVKKILSFCEDFGQSPHNITMDDLVKKVFNNDPQKKGVLEDALDSAREQYDEGVE